VIRNGLLVGVDASLTQERAEEIQAFLREQLGDIDVIVVAGMLDAFPFSMEFPDEDIDIGDGDDVAVQS
jgi:hypothetical protein